MSKNKKMESSDPYEINARKRNIENFKAELAKLKAEQEAQQAANTYKEQFKMGGKLPQYFKGGGLMGSLGKAIGNPITPTLANVGAAFGTYGANRNLMKYYDEKGNEILIPQDRIFNEQHQATLDSLTKSQATIDAYGDYDISDMLAEADRTSQIQQANLRNVSGGLGAGSYASNLGATMAERYRNYRGLYGDKERFRQESMPTKAQMTAGLAQQRFGVGAAEQSEKIRGQIADQQAQANIDAYADLAAQQKAIGSANLYGGIGKAFNQGYEQSLAAKSMPYADFG
jgi:hypothetical protein